MTLRIWIRIRIEPKCWIRIRIRIEVNPDPQPWLQFIIKNGREGNACFDHVEDYLVGTDCGWPGHYVLF
jgi:hypothetical protein